MPFYSYRGRPRATGSTVRRRPRRSYVHRKKKPSHKKVARGKTKITKIVKQQIAKQAETFRNASRVVGGLFNNAPSFESANYFLVNLGGVAQYAGQSISPLNTISAVAIDANSPNITDSNQVYRGKEIYGQYMNTRVTITLPAFRTSPVGNRDWETLPMNYSYRVIFFKATQRPASTVASTGLGRRPMFSMFSNAIGTKFGPSSLSTLAVPDQTGTQGWTNNDLMLSPINRTNWKVLKEIKGKLSVASAMSAHENNASVTRNAQYPSEITHSFTLPINKKIQLQLDDTTPNASTLLTTPLNYDTSIGMMIVMCPLGERYGQATNWNDFISPYVQLDNTFCWRDM